MNNRFQDCKSIIDLHKVLAEGIEPASLNPEEQERLVLVFNTNTGEDVGLPLTPVAFEYICGETEKYAVKAAVEELNNKKETSIMKNTDNIIKNVVNAATDTIAHATANVRVRAGEDVESFKDKADASITTIKDATHGVLDVLDHLTGASSLKQDIQHILYKNSERGSKRGFFDAAAECRRLVYEHIEVIMSYDPDEDDLREVAALRYIIGEDEEGNPIEGHRSIFSAFANGIVWICKKVARKFRSWFGVDEEKNIFGSVGASLASIFGMAAGIIGSVLKVALHTVIFVGSYVLTAVIKAISFIWDKLKGFGLFMKEKFSKDDDAEDAVDEEVLNEELEEERR